MCLKMFDISSKGTLTEWLIKFSKFILKGMKGGFKGKK